MNITELIAVIALGLLAFLLVDAKQAAAANVDNIKWEHRFRADAPQMCGDGKLEGNEAGRLYEVISLCAGIEVVTGRYIKGDAYHLGKNVAIITTYDAIGNNMNNYNLIQRGDIPGEVDIFVYDLVAYADGFSENNTYEFVIGQCFIAIDAARKIQTASCLGMMKQGNKYIHVSLTATPPDTIKMDGDIVVMDPNK